MSNNLTSEIKDLVFAEYRRANDKFPPFGGDHEAYAVTLEEVQELEEALENTKLRLDVLWNLTKHNGVQILHINSAYGEAIHVIEEAIQVAAMCVKWNALHKKEDPKIENIYCGEVTQTMANYIEGLKEYRLRNLILVTLTPYCGQPFTQETMEEMRNAVSAKLTEELRFSLGHPCINATADLEFDQQTGSITLTRIKF